MKMLFREYFFSKCGTIPPEVPALETMPGLGVKNVFCCVLSFFLTGITHFKTRAQSQSTHPNF